MTDQTKISKIKLLYNLGESFTDGLEWLLRREPKDWFGLVEEEEDMVPKVLIPPVKSHKFMNRSEPSHRDEREIQCLYVEAGGYKGYFWMKYMDNGNFGIK